MVLDENPFIQKFVLSSEGHYLIYIKPEKHMALSSFFFESDIEGCYSEERYKTENILEVFNKETIDKYINCHRVFSSEFKKELSLYVSSLSPLDIVDNISRGFKKSDLTVDFLQGLEKWFSAVYSEIGYPAFPKKNISNLFYDVLEVIIPSEKRVVVTKNPEIFKQTYIAHIVDGNTHKISYPQIEKYIGSDYINLKKFEKAYIEYSRYGQDLRGKISSNPDNYLILWEDLFKGANSIFIINAWLESLIENPINPVSQEEFTQGEIEKLKELSKSSNKLTKGICSLMTELFEHYALPSPSFIVNISRKM